METKKKKKNTPKTKTDESNLEETENIGAEEKWNKVNEKQIKNSIIHVIIDKRRYNTMYQEQNVGRERERGEAQERRWKGGGNKRGKGKRVMRGRGRSKRRGMELGRVEEEEGGSKRRIKNEKIRVSTWELKIG